MNVIKLNFVNKSNDVNNSRVVIFQKQVNPDFNEEVIAWTVIQNCGQGMHHPFNYYVGVQLSVSDSYGNYTPTINASPGQLFIIEETPTGEILTYTGPASNPDEIQVLNAMPKGAFNANCYRSGKLLAQNRNLVPQQEAIFEFLPKIYIGVLSEVVEGQVLNSAVVSQVNTELSLFGIKSADIVMRGGGTGKEATPFTFDLENTVMA